MSASTGSPASTELFTRVLGGEWHLYSTHLRATATVTGNQQAKLDVLAELLRLRPGARVLDVGCGWGGSLTYLALRYGVTGVGISLVPQQCEYALRRASRYGVQLDFQPTHWRDFNPDHLFDAVMTSGVAVHFPSLPEYFMAARKWLRSGGALLNEEMHLRPTAEAAAPSGWAMTALDDIRQRGRQAAGRLVIDEEGHYVTLDEELTLLRDAGFVIDQVTPLPMADYQSTVEYWIDNCERQRTELTELVGHDTYRWLRLYFRLFRRLIDDRAMTLDVITAQLPSGQ